jgi:hypothetical protein
MERLRGVYENRSLYSRIFDFLSLHCASSGTKSPKSANANRLTQGSFRLTAPLYLTTRVSKRRDAPVEAKLLEAVFAFDREVIPAGAVAVGKVSQTQPVGKWQRTRAILNGDFTPLRRAEVQFTTLKLPDGRELATHTAESMALNSIYIEPSPRKKKDQKATTQNPNGGILGTAKQNAKDRLNAAINHRSGGFADVVRGPNKKEKLVDLLWSKAPYHPQYWRRGTRFDAALIDPVELGTAAVRPEELGAMGTQPPQDSLAHVRLLTALSSASAKQGEAVEAVVTTPVFSPEHKLVLPEGTKLSGEVVLVKKARSFHRTGQVRFDLQKVDLPLEALNLVPNSPGSITFKTQAILEAAEASTSPIKVDSEGGVKATESKTRFVAPAIAIVVASHASYDARHRDPDEPSGYGGGGPNVSGRTLGGGLGLGMLGTVISQTSPYVGMALGYYGLAWSIYSNVIGRGAEVEFEKNAMMDIKFGARTPKSQFLAESSGQ